MFIFIISVLTVFFISLCFLKSKFWENRYLVLLICCGVALVATLTTNFIVRGHFPNKTEIVSERPLYTFYVQDSLLNDSIKFPYIKDWDYYRESAKNFYKNNDSIHKQIPLIALFYVVKKDTFVGIFLEETRQAYFYLNKIFLAPSSSDSLAIVVEKRLSYDTKSSKWVSDLSLPCLSTITILYIPPREYAAIPKSFIRKIPF